MKVLITGCSSDSYWYNNEIGKVHEILLNKDQNGDFVSATNERDGFHPQDCHVIQSIGTVLMDWEKNGGELQFWGESSKAWLTVEDRNEFRLNSILRIKPVAQYRI